MVWNLTVGSILSVILILWTLLHLNDRWYLRLVRKAARDWKARLVREPAGPPRPRGGARELGEDERKRDLANPYAAPIASDPPARAKKAVSSPVLFWAALIGGVALLLYGYTPHDGPPVKREPVASPRALGPYLVLFGCTAALAAGLIAYAYLLRDRDRVCDAALRRAGEGDADGAIETIRELIGSRGPTGIRLNTLGLLMLQRERWEEAHAAFLEASRIAKLRHLDTYRGNLAWSLAKKGDSAGAAAIFRELCEVAPDNLVFACNYCSVLVDLGRFDEAATQLHNAERIFLHIPTRRRPDRALEEMLKFCREKLSGARLAAQS